MHSITLLTVIYADSSEERYYVPWEDTEQSEYQNRHAFKELAKESVPLLQ